MKVDEKKYSPEGSDTRIEPDEVESSLPADDTEAELILDRPLTSDSKGTEIL
jgi:hypothetical protein